MNKKLITVFGATGAQGNGVVQNLLKDSQYKVRAITRNINSDKAKKLEEMGCEVVSADLTKPETLHQAFENAYGAFVVTNAWDSENQVNEYEQGKSAVEIAKLCQVRHFVWSTLPNTEKISKGKYEVKHFTDKAKVDDLVKNAHFEAYTFVEAPMYFQNLTSVQLQPQPQADGSKAWFFAYGY